MKKYFTSLDLEEGKYVGSVYDPDTNQVVYKTKGYNSQSQVTSDINEYLTKLKPAESKVQPAGQTIVNTAVYKTSTTYQKRCCGR
jgi:hypothetical protein